MRVLLIEDNDQDAGQLMGAVGESAGVRFERVASRHAAEAVLESGEHFDLIICDLRIPAQDDGIDRAPQHGLAVQGAAERALPGTPAVFFTGVAEANIDELGSAMSSGGVTDVLADGSALQMVRLFRKDRLLACAQEVVDLADRLRSLDGLSLEGEPALLSDLDELERRAVCLAARQWSGTRVQVRALGGGLSGRRTLHATVFDPQHERASVFLKIGPARDCHDEKARYNDFVAGTLSHAAFPHLAHVFGPCLGSRGCLVYKFADDWDDSLFARLGQGIDEGSTVEEIRGLMHRWESMVERRRVGVRQLRESEISLELLQGVVVQYDANAEELLTAINNYEDRMVELDLFPQHGDLHGENVLLSAAGQPTLIDGGDIGLHPAALDPVALELSLIAHPRSPVDAAVWPSPDIARRWNDVEAYIEGCPHADMVRACRAWATEVAGPDGLRAVAYQHVTRQMKYDGTPKPVLLAMLRAVLGF